MPAPPSARAHGDIEMAFERLFDPRGIAIVGASGDLSRPGGQTVRSLNDYGYAGGVYPINPKYPEIGGRRCYPSIEAIDGPCDVAVIALGADQLPDVVRSCGRRGIGHAVVFGGGFRETGEEGARAEARMLEAARESGVRLIGPNCLGVVGVPSRAYSAFGSLARAPDLQPGAVSAVLQSGAFGTSLLIRCTLAGVGFRHVVASGNETDIGTPELIEAYVDDPGTRVILAYLEGVRDGRAFLAAARRALAAGKPLVVFKGGRTRQGTKAAQSHTANLTAGYDIVRAAFRNAGVIEVREMDEAADVIQCLLAGRLPRGRNVAVMGGSGGAATVFCDVADEVGLELPSLAPQTAATLEAELPAIGSLQNPIDYTAGHPRPEEADRFERAFGAVLADPGIHQLGFLFATVGRPLMRVAAQILANIVRTSDKPVLVFEVIPDELIPEGRAILREAGIPVLPSPVRVARAMGLLADHADARRRFEAERAEPAVQPFALPALPAGAVTLDEHESKRVLAAAGVPVGADVLLPVDGPASSGVPYPVAVKIVSRDIAHKTEIGGVRLNVADDTALAAAAREVVEKARRAKPEAKLAGVLVSPMVTDGVEAIVGVVNDTAFGPVVAFGLGGVFAETLRDVTYRLAPFGMAEARAMIGELRASPVFGGVRGRPACDTEALAAALVAVSNLAWQMRERLAELDVNPLLVRPRGSGVVAADALVVLR